MFYDLAGGIYHFQQQLSAEHQIACRRYLQPFYQEG
jgi:hypothetical protein